MIPNETTAQDASGSTIAPSGDLRVDLLFHADATAGSSAGTQIGIDRLGKRRARRASSKRPWTLPAPWTRRRAHRALENGGPFPTAPTAILVLLIKGENTRQISLTACDRPATITELRCGRQRAHSPTLRRQKLLSLTGRSS